MEVLLNESIYQEGFCHLVKAGEARIRKKYFFNTCLISSSSSIIEVTKQIVGKIKYLESAIWRIETIHCNQFCIYMQITIINSNHGTVTEQLFKLFPGAYIMFVDRSGVEKVREFCARVSTGLLEDVYSFGSIDKLKYFGGSITLALTFNSSSSTALALTSSFSSFNTSLTLSSSTSLAVIPNTSTTLALSSSSSSCTALAVIPSSSTSLAVIPSSTSNSCTTLAVIPNPNTALTLSSNTTLAVIPRILSPEDARIEVKKRKLLEKTEGKLFLNDIKNTEDLMLKQEDPEKMEYYRGLLEELKGATYSQYMAQWGPAAVAARRKKEKEEEKAGRLTYQEVRACGKRYWKQGPGCEPEDETEECSNFSFRKYLKKKEYEEEIKREREEKEEKEEKPLYVRGTIKNWDEDLRKIHEDIDARIGKISKEIIDKKFEELSKEITAGNRIFNSKIQMSFSEQRQEEKERLEEKKRLEERRKLKEEDKKKEIDKKRVSQLLELRSICKDREKRNFWKLELDDIIEYEEKSTYLLYKEGLVEKRIDELNELLSTFENKDREKLSSCQKKTLAAWEKESDDLTKNMENSIYFIYNKETRNPAKIVIKRRRTR
jgi:hypothetical protein